MRTNLIPYRKQFLDYLAHQKNYSKHTVASYQREICHYEDYLCQEAIENLGDVNYRLLRGYLTSLHQAKLAPSSINHRICALRSYYNYLLKNEVVSENPFTLVTAIKTAQRTPDFLYQEEVDALLDSIDTTTYLGNRNKVMMELMYASGLRCSEVVNLRIDCIDFESQLLLIHGKGNKDRYVPFHDYAARLLQEYLEEIRPMLVAKVAQDLHYVFSVWAGSCTVTFWLAEYLSRGAIFGNRTSGASAVNSAITDKTAPITTRVSWGVRVRGLI